MLCAALLAVPLPLSTPLFILCLPTHSGCISENFRRVLRSQGEGGFSRLFLERIQHWVENFEEQFCIRWQSRDVARELPDFGGTESR